MSDTCWRHFRGSNNWNLPGRKRQFVSPKLWCTYPPNYTVPFLRRHDIIMLSTAMSTFTFIWKTNVSYRYIRITRNCCRGCRARSVTCSCSTTYSWLPRPGPVATSSSKRKCGCLNFGSPEWLCTTSSRSTSHRRHPSWWAGQLPTWLLPSGERRIEWSPYNLELLAHIASSSREWAECSCVMNRVGVWLISCYTVVDC